MIYGHRGRIGRRIHGSKTSVAAGSASQFLLLVAASLFTGTRAIDVRRDPRSPAGLLPLPQAQVIAHDVDEDSDRLVTSGDEGSFSFENLQPGHYRVEAKREGFAGSRAITVERGAVGGRAGCQAGTQRMRFDDREGQRTGTKAKYSERLWGWGTLDCNHNSPPPEASIRALVRSSCL